MADARGGRPGHGRRCGGRASGGPRTLAHIAAVTDVRLHVLDRHPGAASCGIVTAYCSPTTRSSSRSRSEQRTVPASERRARGAPDGSALCVEVEVMAAHPTRGNPRTWPPPMDGWLLSPTSVRLARACCAIKTEVDRGPTAARVQASGARPTGPTACCRRTHRSTYEEPRTRNLAPHVLHLDPRHLALRHTALRTPPNPASQSQPIPLGRSPRRPGPPAGPSLDR